MKRAHSIAALLGLIVLAGTVEARKLYDSFEGEPLSKAWTTSTVLSQGAGAKPAYGVSEGRLTWSYDSGTRNAQQQVLLRGDALPTPGEAVQVRLFAGDFPAGQSDFAGLALSDSGPSMKDRNGLVIFYYEPDARALRLWHFGRGTKDPTVRHEAGADIAKAKTLILRIACTGDDQIRAAWSTDGKEFSWLPALRFGPVKAVGLYNGNSRNARGSRLTFDDFQVLPCVVPENPKLAAAVSTTQSAGKKPHTGQKLPETTPAWTPPDAFLPSEDEATARGWPKARAEHRPGAYWWWPGSAVTKADITWNLETYSKAGWGNMGVIGIYGVRGEESRFINIFTPKWFEMYNHAVTEAKRLDMNIDLTPSSGWRLGGPHITSEHGEQSFRVSDGKITGKSIGASVKRAGPGGAGRAVNPYSESAVRFHLDWLDRHFANGEGKAPRAFYYDSFENPGNWCSEFLESFEELRGYSLEEHAEAMAGKGDKSTVRRVVCDYRETLSEVLIGRVEQIVDWGRKRGSGLRMQAHGAPANLLDMYAAAEIPETEVFGATKFAIPGYRRDPKWIRADHQSDLVNRFASSAAHVAGRELVISESFTWLRNHYHTALSHIKAESDNLLLNGINCIYYHGVCFAPEKTAWPGWLFYASTQANARNSIFRDIPLLNAYITRCQSVLQEGKPHNDVLLYWPVYDLWMGGGTGHQRYTVHHNSWIEGTPCGEAGRWLIDKGHTFDFVSDRQLLKTRVEGRSLLVGGGAEYRTVLVPAAAHMHVETVRSLLDMAEAGATVLVWRTLPQDVPGWKNHGERKKQLGEILGKLAFDDTGAAVVGKGKVVLGDDLATLLAAGAIAREPLVDQGLKFIRRKSASRVSYFIANHTSEPVNAWVPLASHGQSTEIMDPMTGRVGLAPTRVQGDRTDLYLQMQPGETRVLRVYGDRKLDVPVWPVVEPAGEPVSVSGTWEVQFVEGGPALPKATPTETLKCWTGLGDSEAGRFAGAARYTITVKRPEVAADRWHLDLGDVRESARVWVNDEPVGAVVAHPFRVDLGDRLKPGDNRIAIEVTNLSANRIRDLDMRGVPWKKFHDINFVNHNYKKYDGSKWDLKPSGLLGPVRLIPLKVVQPGAGE